MKDLHRLEKYMDKNTIKKLTHLSKLSIPDSDIDELVTNLEKILELIEINNPQRTPAVNPCWSARVTRCDSYANTRTSVRTISHSIVVDETRRRRQMSYSMEYSKKNWRTSTNRI